MSLMFDHFADEGILNTWVQGLTRLTEIITSTAAAASAVAAGGASKDEESVAPAPLSLQLDGTLELVLYATMLMHTVRQPCAICAQLTLFLASCVHSHHD